jgi:hypothetical protein
MIWLALLCLQTSDCRTAKGLQIARQTFNVKLAAFCARQKQGTCNQVNRTIIARHSAVIVCVTLGTQQCCSAPSRTPLKYAKAINAHFITSSTQFHSVDICFRCMAAKTVAW